MNIYQLELINKGYKDGKFVIVYGGRGAGKLKQALSSFKKSNIINYLNYTDTMFLEKIKTFKHKPI